MNAPEMKLNVYQRLSNARAEFHALKLKKSGRNEFAKYNYFELADFLIPAMNVFRTHGLIGIVQFGNELAEIRIINMDDPSDCYQITSPMSSAALKGCHEVQNLGAVQTYLRRYLWVAALEIVEHDAIDSSKPIEEAPKVVATKISPTEEVYKHLNLTEEEREYMLKVVAEAVKIYEEKGTMTSIDNYFNQLDLSHEMREAVPHLLKGAKTKQGKNLHTAWVNWTKIPDVSLAEVM